MKENMRNGGEELDEELEEAVAEAFRPEPAGEFEQLLASNLASALFNPPLEKIRLILEAYLLLPDEQKEMIANEEEDRKIRKLYEVAVSLSNVVEVKPTPYHHGRYASIPWSFSWNHGHEYLGLFIKGYWDLSCFYRDWKEFEKLRERDPNLYWDIYLQNLTQYLASGWAPLAMVEAVKNQFVTEIMPFALRVFRKIYENFISTEVWIRAIETMSGKRRKSEEPVK